MGKRSDPMEAYGLLIRATESHGRVSRGVTASDSHLKKLLLLMCVKYTTGKHKCPQGDQ